MKCVHVYIEIRLCELSRHGEALLQNEGSVNKHAVYVQVKL